MDGPHLDRDGYLRLRAGTLPPDQARALAEHLDQGCATCEAFLAALSPDALDGAVDEALTSLAPPAAIEAGHDLEYARIGRALAPRRRLGPVRVLALAAAVALAAGVAVQVVRQRQVAERAWEGEKGSPAAVPARLRFAVVEGGAGAPRLDRGRTGLVLPQEASLAFRVEVGRPATLVLLRIGGGEREVVWRGRADHPGALDVSEGGRPAAYPLRGLAGPQRFALVASEGTLEDDDLAAAARAAADPAASAADLRSRPLTLDVVEVTVR